MTTDLRSARQTPTAKILNSASLSSEGTLKTKKDILAENFMAVHNAKTGNGLKPRLDIPDGMEVFLYGG